MFATVNRAPPCLLWKWKHLPRYMSCVIWCDPSRAASCGGVDSQLVAFILHQHPLQLHARGGGAALPVLLAAHLHPSAAWLHAGYCVLSHPLPGGAAVQLFTQTEGAACGRGQCCFLLFWPSFLCSFIWFWFGKYGYCCPGWWNSWCGSFIFNFSGEPASQH